MKLDLNSEKPDLRLTAIRDPEQTTPASQLPLLENKPKKKRKRKEKQKTRNNDNHKKARRTDP